MAVMTTRPATMDDLDDLLAIEASAIPGYGYMNDNRFFYLGPDHVRGEMVLALADGAPVGMGQYSVLPDGSGWLEILRVKKEWQHQGAGKAIYKRYMQLAEETKAPSVAMFTGRKNLASKGLAELHGFHLAAAMLGYSIPVEGAGEKPAGFHLVTDPAQAKALIEPTRAQWGPFMALNRTFLHYNDALYTYLCGRGMVYTDGKNTVVLGCRMLEERGWHIGFFAGDAETCLAFALAATKEKGLPKVDMMFPPEREDLKALMAEKGWAETGELIIMELDRTK